MSDISLDQQLDWLENRVFERTQAVDEKFKELDIRLGAIELYLQVNEAVKKIKAEGGK